MAYYIELVNLLLYVRAEESLHAHTDLIEIFQAIAWNDSNGVCSHLGRVNE